MTSLPFSHPIARTGLTGRIKYKIGSLEVPSGLATVVKRNLGRIEALLRSCPDQSGLILALPDQRGQLGHYELFLDDPASRPFEMSVFRLDNTPHRPETGPAPFPGFCFAWVPNELNLVLLEEERDRILACSEGHGLPGLARSFCLSDPREAAWLINFFPWTYYQAYQYLADPSSHKIDESGMAALGRLVYELAWNLSGLKKSSRYGSLLKATIPYLDSSLSPAKSTAGTIWQQLLGGDPLFRESAIKYYEALFEIFCAITAFADRISEKGRDIWGSGDEQELAALEVNWKEALDLFAAERPGWKEALRSKRHESTLLAQGFCKMAQAKLSLAMDDYGDYLGGGSADGPARYKDQEKLLSVLWELAALEAQHFENSVSLVKRALGIDRIHFFKYQQWYPLDQARLNFLKPKT